ncbi:RNA-binding protein, partial [Enterococcus faecium]|nr:RNA-binding protein [Enterococcus faecium]
MNKQELIETLEKLNKYSKRCIGIDKHEDYWRGKTDAYFNLIGLAKQLDEPKKLVIPQLVAGW